MSIYTPITYDNMFWGIPKAWVNVDTNGNILKGYNISSVKKSTIGTFVLNFTSNMADVNYIIIANANHASDLVCCVISAQSIGSFTINTRESSAGKLIDPVNVYCIIC